MKRNIVLIGVSVVLSALLGACGSDSDGDSAKTISGVVSDGKIKGASVSLYESGSQQAVETVTSDENGAFHFDTVADETKGYSVVATGGIDADTLESFKGVLFESKLALFEDQSALVVSPITSLVSEKMTDGSTKEEALEAVKAMLGVESSDLLKDPSGATLPLQMKAMKLSMMAKEGISFDAIADKLDADGTIDGDDLSELVSDVTIRAKLQDALDDLQNATDQEDIIATYVKKRYLREIVASVSDVDLSDSAQISNLKQLSEYFYTQDSVLSGEDITATLGGGITQADINVTNGFDPSAFSIVKVSTDIEFSNSLKTSFYEIENPKTLNQQLIAFDYDSGKSHVVNTNVILKDKVFIYSGEKDGDYAKYTNKKYGLYLDPEQESEIRVGESMGSEYTYTFYSNNALMKFNPLKPSESSTLFSSANIPQSLKDAGIVKLGAAYSVYENIVDVDNSYIVLNGFDSLADTVKEEDENDKKYSAITMRVGDSKAIAGEPIVIIKDSDMKTSGLLVSYTAPYVPSTTTDNTYKLKLYNSTLTSSTDIADGDFFYATQNDDYIYLYKNGSDKLWALAKQNGNSLTEVSGISLAGEFDKTIHSQTSRHGQTGTILTGASSLSGVNRSLSDGDDAYLTFNYDLQDNTNNIFVFGSYGAYKHSQAFKITGTSGEKVFDNGDSVDNSLEAGNTEANDGHINLIAVWGDKLYIETGWNDGNATLGGECTTGYPSPASANAMGCFKLKYGYVNIEADEVASDTTMLTYAADGVETKNMTVTGLPYYVSRRVSPLAANGKLYVSLFAGGTSSTGYLHNLYTFDLGDTEATSVKEGRTYFVKSAKKANGEFKGSVISWSKNPSGITEPDGTLVADTSTGLTDGGRSVSAVTNGVPLAGIGTIGMLKNDNGGHNFELFTVDTSISGDSFQSVDLAPYGGWIYE